MKKTILAGYCLLLALLAQSQGRLVLNGAVVTISNGAYLVVANPSPTAITRNSGYLVSEGENNRVRWSLGTTAGTYTVPWGRSGAYLPLRFTKSGGSGAGVYNFSTYRTAWKNSDLLPAGVSSMAGSSGADQSAWTLDRFWQVQASGYTVNPDLSDLVFTYADVEHTASGNTIMESKLQAQSWNEQTAFWNDALSGTINTTANTVTVSQVTGGGARRWWSLTEQFSTLPLGLIEFAATAQGQQVVLRWQTVSEGNDVQFAVQRSKDGIRFETVGTTLGKGGTQNSYTLVDAQPFTGYSYYRIAVTEQAALRHTAIRRVLIGAASSSFRIQPNPVVNHRCGLHLPAPLPQAAVVTVYDAAGRAVYSTVASAGVQTILLQLPASLPAGSYWCRLQWGAVTEQQAFVLQ